MTKPKPPNPGTVYTARKNFKLRAGDQTEPVKDGDRFVVASPVSYYTIHNVVRMTRESNNSTHSGWNFSLKQLIELFEME